MRKTYLVTGGAGFIGSNLVHRLLQDSADAEVVVIDALTYAGNLTNLKPSMGSERLHFIRGDIRIGDFVRQVFHCYRPDVVFHLAAESHVDRSIDGPGEFVTTNVLGTFEMLEAARERWTDLGAAKDSFRFVHVSTDEVYGSLGMDDALFIESSPYAPNSPYAATKAASDHLVRAWHRTYGLPTIITHCSNNYGAYQFPEKLIPLVILNALEGKALPVYGDGQNIRDWIFVGDHCEALSVVAEKGAAGETYNIGGRCERTTLQVVESVCDKLDLLRPPPGNVHCKHRDLIAFVKDRPGHDRRYAIDCSKIYRDLGWSARTTFDLGIGATVLWYLDHLAWCQGIANGSYRRERLGLG